MKIFEPCYNKNCKWFLQWEINFGSDIRNFDWGCFTCIYFQRADQYERKES
jgi:hypothetical protein